MRIPGFRYAWATVLLSGLLCSPAAARDEAPAAPAEPGIEAARDLLGAWRVEEARTVVSRLMEERPGSAETLDLGALLAYYEGDYAGALETVERSLEVEAEDDQRQALRLLLQRTRDATRRFRRFESEHFLLYLHDERDGILAEPALAALEKAQQEVGRELGYRPRSRVRVEVAPDVQSFNAISTLSLRDIEETGAVGLCKFNKVMILSPRVLARGYRWLDSLVHEYIHFAIVNLTRNKTPIWLHEGIARYYETLWRNPVQGARPDYLTPANETLLATASATGEFVGFEEMEPSLIRLDTPEQVQLAYAEAASAVDYIRSVRGPGGVREVLGQVERTSAAEAIEAVMGAPLERFEADWREFVRGQGLRVVEGSRIRTYEVKDESRSPEMVELGEIRSEIARNRTHLGDRMRARGRLRAAAAEYRRALRAGPNSTVILERLGEALVHGQRYEEALPYLEKARRLNPDSVRTWFLKGRLHHGAGDYAAARGTLEEALQINPFHPGVRRLLGGVHEALGDEAEARKAREVLERLGGR